MDNPQPFLQTVQLVPIGPNWPQPNFKQTAYLGSSNLKRKNADFYGPLKKTTKRTKITRYTSPLTRKAQTKNKYKINKYKKRLRKRRLNNSLTAQPQTNDQEGEYTQHKLYNDEQQPTDIESENRPITDENQDQSKHLKGCSGPAWVTLFTPFPFLDTLGLK